MPKKTITDSSDRDQIDALAKQERDLDKDYEEVMKTAAGRAVMADLIDNVCHVSRISFQTDPHATAFNEGARSIGLALDRRLRDTNREHYIRMIAEHFA